MSIQAMKGVEIGDGFEVAGRRGSEAHDEILWDDDAGEYTRGSTRAGGTEGGMTTGGLLVARVAMKPLATLNRPVLKTVDIDHQGGDGLVQGAHRRHRGARVGRGRRDDGRARARGRRRRASSAATRSRSSCATTPRTSRRCGRRAVPADAPRHLVLVGLMGAGKTTVGQRCAELLDRPFVDTDELVVADGRHPVRRDLSAAEGEQGFRVRERVAVADAVRVAAAARDLVRRRRRARRRQPAVAPQPRASSCGSRRRPRRSASRVGRRRRRGRCSPVATATATLERLASLREPRLRGRRARAVDTEGRTVDEVAAAVLEEFARGTGDRRARGRALRRRRRRRRARRGRARCSAGAAASRS